MSIRWLFGWKQCSLGEALRSIFLLPALALSFAGEFAFASEGIANPGFPFVQTYCLSCHSATKKKGDLD
jgi:hypothetical protein